MNIDRYTPPDLSYGFLPEYVNSGRSFRLRPGQLITSSPSLAHTPNLVYLEAGLTNILVSAGYGPQDADYAKLATCLGNEYLRSYLPQKPINEWDEAECIGAVDTLVNARGGGWGHTTGQMVEAYNDLVPWRVTNGSPQQRYIDGRLQQRLDQVGRGGRHAGEYNGSILIDHDQRGADYYRDALIQGGNAALQMAMEWAAFEDAFFTQQAWQWRHGSLNFYYVGQQDVHRFINQKLVAVRLDQQAKQAVNTNRRTTAFGWSGKYQSSPNDFAVQYQESIDGGTLYAYSFPSWTSGAQIGLYFLALAADCDFFSWEDATRKGLDRTIVLNQQDDWVHYEGGNGLVQRRPYATEYTPDDLVAFPATPDGGQDLALVAADMFSRAGRFAGFGSIWTAHRSGEGNFSDAAAGDHLIDCYVNHQGYSRLGGQENRRWYFYMNTGLAAGEWEIVEARLQPGVLSFEAEGSTPHLFFITL